jgi:hypothetical protein
VTMDQAAAASRMRPGGDAEAVALPESEVARRRVTVSDVEMTFDAKVLAGSSAATDREVSDLKGGEPSTGAARGRV